MASIGRALRRTLFLLVLAAAVGAALSWRRSQDATPTPAQPPQWPDWPERESSKPASAPAAEPESAPAGSSQPAPEPGFESQSAPEADGPTAWVPPRDDGSAPESHPIKVKVASGIFHVPGGRFYDRARPDRCYPTADAAEADGYRRSKT